MGGYGAPRKTPAAAGPQTDPSVHQLRLLLVLAEELHFGRAAARLFMTQPALSRQIKALEDRLTIRLVERTTRTVVLTPAGQALLPAVRDAVSAMDLLRREADSHGRSLTGRLSIGSIGAEAAMPFTHAILDQLRSRHPDIDVRMSSLNFVDHIAALVSGDVDVAFLRPPVPPGIGLLHLATEPRVACLPADDPLAAAPRLTLAQLGGHTFLDVPPEAPRIWWDFWAVNPRPDGTAVRFGGVVSDMEGLLHAVARGEGICFLPAAARKFYPRPGIAYRDVTDLAPSTSALAWLDGNRDQPAVAAIRRAARTVLARTAQPPA
ncbi:LysR family transcriptional regulator [Polymorphospora rubra]|uniref:LysR family transcriptional regulator n=1 Tax=Polymorphospora rubra TaxID=338584 RepID=A0A810MYC4_9ACTN|nr:LysR family transcriptional regulator [Polymorphospora rubra]BCJ66261.1 LysR family transcriptional regulator [Polymorphospora rubra]